MEFPSTPRVPPEPPFQCLIQILPLVDITINHTPILQTMKLRLLQLRTAAISYSLSGYESQNTSPLPRLYGIGSLSWITPYNRGCRLGTHSFRSKLLPAQCAVGKALAISWDSSALVKCRQSQAWGQRPVSHRLGCRIKSLGPAWATVRSRPNSG